MIAIEPDADVPNPFLHGKLRACRAIAFGGALRYIEWTSSGVPRDPVFRISADWI